MNVMMLDNYSIRKANIVIYNDCFSLEQCDEIQELQKGRDVILSNDDESFYNGLILLLNKILKIAKNLIYIF